MSPRRRVAAMVAVAMLGAGLAACSDDGGGGGDGLEANGGATGDAGQTYCEFTEDDGFGVPFLQFSDPYSVFWPDVEAAKDVAVPDEIEDEWQFLLETVEESDDGPANETYLPDTSDVHDAVAAISRFHRDNCG